MHSVMMTSTPALHYWKPASVDVMSAVRQWRSDGLSACYTVDAGPNVHVICPKAESNTVDKHYVRSMGVTDVLVAKAGGPAKIVDGKFKSKKFLNR